MSGPIDYSGAFAEHGPQEALLSGLKMGSVFQDMQMKREQAEAAAAQKKKLADDMQGLYDDPSPAAIARMSVKYPQLSEGFKRAFDMQDTATRQGHLEELTQTAAALESGRMDIVEGQMQQKATALRNAGKEQEASATEAMLDTFKRDPKLARITVGKMLSATAGPEKYAASMAAIGGEGRADQLQPAAVLKASADAAKAGIDAGVAQQTAPMQVQQAQENILTAQAKRRIDDLNVQISQADSETKRGQLVLERDKLVAEQTGKGTEKADAAQAQIDSAQHALDNIVSLKNHPMMKNPGSLGNWTAGMGTVLGQMLGNVPGTENKDFRGQVESLKSQVFLPAVQQVKGMGALSNAEGEKLTAAVAALDPNMSPKAFQNALGVVEKYMTKGLQKGVANKAVPVQGGGFVVNHPTFGPVREGDINRLMKQYPGSTREQVMMFLNSNTGGASANY